MINKVKTYVTKNPALAGCIVGLVGLVVLVMYLWITASSVTKVPKAEEYGKQSANANAVSVQAENNANVSAAQIAVVEAQRQTAKTDALVAKAAKDQAEINRIKRKVEYENFRKKGVVVDANNLDARERQLITDLNNLYNSNTQ